MSALAGGEDAARPGRSAIASFAVPAFRAYAASAQVAFIGSWMLGTSQSLLVLDLSGGSGAVLGITAAIQFVPLLVLGPVIGVLADRWGPRRLLIAGESTMALVGLAQATSLLLGIMTLPLALVLAAVYGLGSALESAMRPTVITEIVPARVLSNAVGLNTLFFQLGRLVGPSAAGFLIAGFGNGPSFVVGATALGVFALVLTRLPRRRDGHPDGDEAIPAGMGHAVHFVLTEPRLRLVFALTAVAGLISPNILSIATLAATQDFSAGATGVGLLGSALAVGTIAGAALTAVLGRVTPRSIAAAALGVCLLTAATGALPTFPLYAVGLVPAGIASMLLMAQGAAFVQLVTPRALRGRVNALFAMVTLCGIPLGSPVLGTLADAVGARSASVLAGAAVALALGFVLLALRGGLRRA